MYKDRDHAGRCLAEHLRLLKPPPSLILAIPRGGVIVGHRVARDLEVDLDIVMAKKIGAPMNPEFAVAAVDGDGRVTLPEGGGVFAAREYIKRQSRIAKKELEERLCFYRGDRKPKSISGKKVAIVDDGLATGLTARAAIKYVKESKPQKLILAVPVAPKETLKTLSGLVDEVVCPLIPSPFYAVGQWYESFGQVCDEAVRQVIFGPKPQ